MPRLKITTGKQAGKTFDLSKATIIGRGETAQVQISDTHASREHCKVFEQGGAWVVADLNSRNGFKVNGVQTTRKNLSSGDKIVIGETTLEFDAGGAAPAKSAGGGESKKEAAFAAARAASAPARGGAAAAPRAAAPSGEGGLKVSDRVLQYSKVDASKAGVLDVDLTQSAAMSRFLVTLACLAFLGLVVWLVIKMMA
jgi:predicted component of type VI protein secretion system